jgi:hypothetical protein
LWHLGIGAAGTPGLAHDFDHDAVSVGDPELTIGQIRGATTAVLPGLHIRRRLLWRYLPARRASNEHAR